MATKKPATSAAAKPTKSKGAFPNMLGGSYRLDPLTEIFIPGVDGDPEFPTLNQKWRAIETIDESDVESVLRNGVITPIEVRKRKDGRGEVVDGRQRSRWARLANERLLAKDPNAIPITIRAVLIGEGNEALVHQRTVETGYHRVAPSPMQQSQDAVVTLSLMGETDLDNIATSSLKEVASRLRCSVDKVRNLVKLQKLAPAVQAMVADRSLQMTVALGLLDLTEEEQVAKAKEFAAKRAAGVGSADMIEQQRREREQGDDEGNEGTGQTAAPPKAAATSKGLRMGQIKGLLRLIEADREAGSGAGCSVDDAVVRFIKVALGKAEPKTSAGMTELLNRLATGE